MWNVLYGNTKVVVILLHTWFFSHASSRYHTHMENQSKENQKKKQKRKVTELQEQLDDAIAGRKELEGRAKKLMTDADKKAKDAESKKDFYLLSSSNALRKRAKLLSEKDIPEQEKKIEELEAKCKHSY